jgi:predicted permease
MTSSIVQDARYAVRTLIRNPGFAALSVLALALGIGANSAIFTVVNSVLLSPLRFHKPEELVVLRERNLKAGFPEFSLSPGNYQGYRDRNRSFTGLAAVNSGGMNFVSGPGAEPERLRGARVTTNLFEVLGAQPSLGRVFTTQEGQLGSQFVIILGHSLWQRRFGGGRDVLGKQIKLNDEMYTVVGVMPAGFEFPGRAELWTPLAMDRRNWDQRGGHYLSSIGRLRGGTSIAAALRDLNTIAAQAEKDFPDSNTGWDAKLVGLQESVVGEVRPAMAMLAAAVGFVLLIACVNVANLLLSRSAARRREIGVRCALGAGRGRLVRQLLTESILLSSAGALLGLGLAWAGTRLLVNLTPDILPRAREIGVDLGVVAFTAAIAVLTGVLFGLAPALQMARTDVNSALRDGGRGNSVGFRHNGLRSVLVVGQVSLALVLLSGAGLLMRSFYTLQGVDPGFDPHGMLTFRTNLPNARYKTPAERTAFYQRAIDKISALPGVTAAAAAQIFPLTNDDYILSFSQVGKPSPGPGKEPNAAYYAATPGYFRALRIPLKSGRDFTAHDDAASPRVAVVSESMARRFYPDENPIGQSVIMGNSDKPSEIIGVVGDVRDQGLESKGLPAVYQPAAQAPFGGMYFGVRAERDPAQLIAGVRRTMREIDAELPLDAVGTVDQLVETALSSRRFSMLLMAIFAGIALALAVVGVYGVVSYSVTQATREIGIRMALGAQAQNVFGIVLRYAGVLMGAGIAIGVGAALGAGRLLAAQLFEIKATDPATYVLVALVLGATAIPACLIPAWRAMRVDPLHALRNE